MNIIQKISNKLFGPWHEDLPAYHVDSFMNNRWDGNLDNLSSDKIYCYQSDDGGIYKTMELSLIGNEDVPARVGMNTYFAFVRIDNSCGYCQFSYKSLRDLFVHHEGSRHFRFQKYEFDNQKDFIHWCYSRPKQYTTPPLTRYK